MAEPAQPDLLLHVGHSKTGSSALQSSFALSAEALLAAGIHYPRGREDARARQGRITSGNLDPTRLARTYFKAARQAPDARAILLSNEAWFAGYLNHPEPLREAVAQGIRIRILMFLRDPVDWAMSSYMQMVKRGGAVNGFDQFLQNNKFPRRVEQFFEMCEKMSLPMMTRNYSRCRNRLLPETETLLGVPARTLTPPPVSQVNRSMTRSELYILRAINREFGASAGYGVADALCEDLPDLQAEAPPLQVASFDAYIEKVAPILKRLNRRISAEDAYRIEAYDDYFDAVDPGADPAMSISQGQLDVIVRALRAGVDAAQGEATPPPDRPTADAKGVLRRAVALLRNGWRSAR